MINVDWLLAVFHKLFGHDNTGVFEISRTDTPAYDRYTPMTDQKNTRSVES